MKPDYLIHFNRQHDPKTGKFVFGDGDGDGIANDHAHAGKKDGMISRIGSSQKTSSGPSSGGSKALSTPYKRKSDYSLRDEHRQVLNNVKETAGPNANTSSKTWLNSNRNNYVDEQKVTNVQAGNIYVTRNLGSSLIDLYEEDEEEKKRKKKRLLQQTTLDGKTLKEEPAKKKQHMGYTNIKQTYKLKPKK